LSAAGFAQRSADIHFKFNFIGSVGAERAC
jgi:hypothetical protein